MAGLIALIMNLYICKDGMLLYMENIWILMISSQLENVVVYCRCSSKHVYIHNYMRGIQADN